MNTIQYPTKTVRHILVVVVVVVVVMLVVVMEMVVVMMMVIVMVMMSLVMMCMVFVMMMMTVMWRSEYDACCHVVGCRVVLVLATIAFAFLLLPMCQHILRPCTTNNK